MTSALNDYSLFTVRESLCGNTRLDYSSALLLPFSDEAKIEGTMCHGKCRQTSIYLSIYLDGQFGFTWVMAFDKRSEKIREKFQKCNYTVSPSSGRVECIFYTHSKLLTFFFSFLDFT